MPLPTKPNTAPLNQPYVFKGSKGFTLIELLVVTVIIGILAALAIPAYNSYIDKARMAVAISTLDTIRKDLESFHIDNREYPTKPIDFSNGTDGKIPPRTVFSSMMLNQINDDLDLTDVFYNTVTSGYVLKVKAKNKEHTELTLTPTDISKAP